MRIRKVFLLSIALGSAVGALAALLFALQQWSSWQAARWAARDTQLLAEMLHLTESMNVERGYVNLRFAEPDATDPEQLAPVMKQFRRVDTILAETLELSATPTESADLHGIEVELPGMRQAALAAIGLPRSARPAGAVDTYLQRMFAAQEVAWVDASAIQVRVTATNPDIGQITRLALLASDLRDWAGRQTAVLVSYIGQRLPMAGEQAERLAEFNGRIQQKWHAVRLFADAAATPEIVAALADIEHGYWDQGGEAYANYVVPNRGQTLELDAGKVGRLLKPMLDTILPLRDRALSEALRRSDADIALRLDRFVMALSLLLLTAGAAFAARSWFDRVVVRPTEQITDIILALADGDHGVRVPLQDRNDEVGQMARAIESLRRNAHQAKAVAREMLLLRQARDEEKNRLLAELTSSNEDLAALNHELESLATTDALTGVPNRRSFNLALGREWRRAQREETPLGMLLMDVDYFKSFNDRYGHLAGDACLARVAMAVNNAIRRPNDVTARYGGEEFAVVLPVTTLDGAVSVAEHVRQAVADLEIPHLDNPSRTVTISVGVAVAVPRASDTPETLLAAADSALYVAKRSGRNRIATCDQTVGHQEQHSLAEARTDATEPAG